MSNKAISLMSELINSIATPTPEQSEILKQLEMEIYLPKPKILKNV